ncbi:paramyosin-like [Pocillopora verrucosa]|uniref:paramyosin-like n=1 Tax=Pocillopora verrucosa TaxID=203993 RepID=UPI003340D701
MAMASQNADPHQSKEELEKLLSVLEEENRKLEIDLGAQNKKIANISAFRADTRRAMAEELYKLEKERENVMVKVIIIDAVNDELKKLQNENERYESELDQLERRSRDRQELEIVSDSDVEEAERRNAQLTEEITDIEHRMTEKITADYERKAAALTKAEQENSSLEESIKKDKLEVKAFRESIKEHERTEQQIEKDFENARLEVICWFSY